MTIRRPVDMEVGAIAIYRFAYPGRAGAALFKPALRESAIDRSHAEVPTRDMPSSTTALGMFWKTPERHGIVSMVSEEK